MRDRLFDFFSYDEKFIRRELEKGTVLCMVLNKELSAVHIGMMAKDGYIMQVLYEGEERLALAAGCYKNKQKRFDIPDPAKVRGCKKLQGFMDGIYPKKLFKAKLENPLCLLLDERLSNSLIEIVEQGYETFTHDYAGKTYTAIACVYYDPDHQFDGRVVGQW